MKIILTFGQVPRSAGLQDLTPFWVWHFLALLLVSYWQAKFILIPELMANE